MPATGIVRPISSSGSPSTARQTSSAPPGSSVQQSAASALTSERSSVDEALDHDVEAEVARERLARPSAAPAARPGGGRSRAAGATCRTRPPPRGRRPRRARSRSGSSRRRSRGGTRARRGAAPARRSASPARRARRARRARGRHRGCRRRAPASRGRPPRPPCAASRAARLTTGSRLTRRRAAAHPSASHSAATPGRVVARSPSLTKQRAASTATPISASTAGSTSSTSRRDRSSSETCEISRSRSRASASAIVARDRSSASPAFADERLHPAELLLVEHARAANGAEDDGDHLVRGTNGHVDAALGLRDRVQTLVDDGGVLGVVDRERRPLAHGGVDPGRLAVEREPLADEAGVIPAALAGRDDHGGEPVVLDQRQVGEVELERVGELVEQHLRDVGRLGRVEQLLREPRRPSARARREPASVDRTAAISPQERTRASRPTTARGSAATVSNGTASNSTA